MIEKAKLVELAMDALQEDDYLGICVECGATRSGCEPDARKYECEECGTNSVYGAEEILVMHVP